MNRIASDLMILASELLPRIKATFTRKPETEDRDLNSIHFDIQRFVSTLRKNEELECIVSRRDDGKMMEVTVGFSDHESMKGIVDNMDKMIKKLAKRNDLQVKVEVSDKK